MEGSVLRLVALALLGLCMGSFVNAIVWRIRQQSERRSGHAKAKKGNPLTDRDLSIMYGRSMCAHCHHPLGAADLVPLFSWLLLRGKCRYCRQRIDDSPWVELCMPVAFVLSYLLWPQPLVGGEWVHFGFWLAELVLLGALLVYDARWMLLPNRLVFPLILLAAGGALVTIVMSGCAIGGDLVDLLTAAAIAGGLFYLLFWLSKGVWIGGGDVKLGYALGLIVMTPVNALLLLFVSSLLGTLYALPSMAMGKLGHRSRVPFGPFLILGTYVVVLYGQRIADWYLGVLGY